MIYSSVLQNKKVWRWGVVLILSLVLLWGLSPQTEGRRRADKAIDASGGMKVWEKKQTVQFLETRIFYDPAGQMVDKKISLHRFILGKIQKGRIDSIGDPTQKTLLGFDGIRGWSLVNGVLSADPIQKETAEARVGQSRYLFSIPFSFKEKGQTLTYEGKDRVRVDFTDKKKWMLLYFDRHHRVTKILFSHGELAEWLDYQAADGIVLATRRVFYPADEKGEIKGAKTREELIEEIEFRPYFPGSLFDSPRGNES